MKQITLSKLIKKITIWTPILTQIKFSKLEKNSEKD